jgi:putative exporter of polyketide antibiotics
VTAWKGGVGAVGAGWPWLVAVAVVLAVTGLAGFRRRDLM